MYTAPDLSFFCKSQYFFNGNLQSILLHFEVVFRSEDEVKSADNQLLGNSRLYSYLLKPRQVLFPFSTFQLRIKHNVVLKGYNTIKCLNGKLS